MVRCTHAVITLSLLAACGDDRTADDVTPDAAATPDAVDTGRPEGVALCYTDLSSNHPATAAFWDAMRADVKDERAAAIAGLEAAVDEHDGEEELHLLLGLAHLWRLAEPLPAEAADPNVQLQSALASREHLERAYELCPTDHRIPAWLGPILVNTGRALNDQATIDEGMAILQQGIDHYPSFVLFSKLLVYADAPRDSADFQQALDAIEANIDYCTGTTDPACSNHPHAAHNIEGSMVFLGDVFAKAGQRDDALATYEAAMQAATYDGWNWHALLEDRIATVDARVAALGNDDPADDPEVMWKAGNQCSICHAE